MLDSLRSVGLPLADTFVTSARTAAELLTCDPVRDRWDAESACAGMTVGGLACHLAGQAGNAVRLVSAAPSTESPIPVEEHYRRAAWANTDLDEEVNLDIRTSANDEADAGFEGLCARVAADLEALPGVLEARGADDPVLIPGQGWSLTAHDLPGSVSAF